MAHEQYTENNISYHAASIKTPDTNNLQPDNSLLHESSQVNTVGSMPSLQPDELLSHKSEVLHASTLSTTDWNTEWKLMQRVRRRFDDAQYWNKRSKSFGSKDAPSPYVKAFLEKADIKEILTTAAKENTAAGEGTVVPCNLMELYTAHLRASICKELEISEKAGPFKGMHIVVDAGNGAGGFFATDVLAPLGADISGSRFLEPDGMFPHHVPNPEDETAMAAVKEAVLTNHADLGLIFDTDVDRMSAVLSDGTEVNRNALIAMMAAILAPDYPGSTIITDSVTSDGLTD